MEGIKVAFVWVLTQQRYLRITEIMYHPADEPDLEFLELKNIGTEPLDLTPVSLTGGIEFRFADGEIPELAPGEHVIVVSRRAVFESWYEATGILIAGEYSGQLSNGGERITLLCAGSATILDFTYDDAWYPATDRMGHSLVIIDPLADPTSWGSPLSWRPSEVPGGSPGAGESPGPAAGRQLNGDSNQDATLDISDALSMLFRLLGGTTAPLPCRGDSLTAGGNLILLDSNGDADVDLSDVIYLLNYLFIGGAAPVQGSGCKLIEGCPDLCAG